MKRLKFIVFLILSAILLAGCVSKNEAFSHSGFYFDTAVSMTLYGKDGKSEENTAIFDETCSYFNDQISSHTDSGAIFELNTKNSVSVDKNIAAILTISASYTSILPGYDFGLGNLIDLWDIKSENPHVPSDEEIKAALQPVLDKTYKITADGDVYTFTKSSDFKVDLGGIAKGYVGDILRAKLMEKGVTSGILNMGSSTIILIGSKPDGSDYKLAMQKPFSETGESDHVLNVSNAAVSTSGVYERYFEQNGKIYHHILNPFTGYPTENELYGVTVIVKYDGSVTNEVLPDIDFAGALSDALSTALMVQGTEHGLKLVESLPNVEAIFINNEYNYTYSSGIVLDGNTFSLLD